LIIRRIGADAHLELSAHMLRHTCLTDLVRRGNDLALVAEIAGQTPSENDPALSFALLRGFEKAMGG
jgi:hypothetical protein